MPKVAIVKPLHRFAFTCGDNTALMLSRVSRLKCEQLFHVSRINATLLNGTSYDTEHHRYDTRESIPPVIDISCHTLSLIYVTCRISFNNAPTFILIFMRAHMTIRGIP